MKARHSPSLSGLAADPVAVGPGPCLVAPAGCGPGGAVVASPASGLRVVGAGGRPGWGGGAGSAPPTVTRTLPAASWIGPGRRPVAAAAAPPVASAPTTTTTAIPTL